MKKIIVLVGFLGVSIMTFGQSEEFATLLEKGKVNLAKPLENTFKEVKVIRNDFMDYQHAIKSKKSGLEVRYAIQPVEHGAKELPHVLGMITAVNTASNDEKAHTFTKVYEPKEVKAKYKGDWGAIFRFSPKRSFSTKKYCTMLALYSEEKANVYVFFLYDKMTNKVYQEIENMKRLIAFKGF